MAKKNKSAGLEFRSRLGRRDGGEFSSPRVGLGELVDGFFRLGAPHRNTCGGHATVRFVHIGPVGRHERELGVLRIPMHLRGLDGRRLHPTRGTLELGVSSGTAFTIRKPSLAAGFVLSRCRDLARDLLRAVLRRLGLASHRACQGKVMRAAKLQSEVCKNEMRRAYGQTGLPFVSSYPRSIGSYQVGFIADVDRQLPMKD